MEIYLVCLANSYKRGGRCIAGIEIVPEPDGQWTIVRHPDGRPRWIRPIAPTQFGEIPNSFAIGFKLFCIIKLTDAVICPDCSHSENVRYSRMEVFQSSFDSNPATLKLLIDNVHQSILGNRGKAISAEMTSKLDYSLMFIHVQNAKAFIDENREKAKNRMLFSYYGTEYVFPITDPVFLGEFRKEPERFAVIPDVYFTISLGLEYEGWFHKLVAGVFIPKISSQVNGTEDISYMEQQKQIHTNAYAKWTDEDDRLLKELYGKGISVEELSQIFGRNKGAILARINKKGIEKRDYQQEQTNWFDEYERELTQLLSQKTYIEEQINVLRQKLLKQMESLGIDKVHSRHFSVNYTPAKTVMQFDSRTFRTENEELYSRYCKPMQRDASIVVKRNKLEEI